MTTPSPPPPRRPSSAPHRCRLDQGRAADLRHRRRAVERRTSAPPRATPALVAEIRALLLKHKVLFFRDQDITRAEHVAFARHFGELEDHPVAGSDPGEPGPRAHLQVARQPERPLRELLAHRRHLAREAAVRLRAALRRVPAGRRRHDVGQHGRWPTSGCPSTSRRRSPACAHATASRPASARRCRSRSASR